MITKQQFWFGIFLIWLFFAGQVIANWIFDHNLTIEIIKKC